MSDFYRYVLIRTYRAHGEQSKHQMRAKPLPSQGLSVAMRVECSSKMREGHPPGTIFKVLAKVKDTDRDPHLYTSWQWFYEVLTPEQAELFIRAKRWDATRPVGGEPVQDLHRFDHRVDGLERTEWFLYARHLPEHKGTYEICAWKGADITRCHWDGAKWWAADRLAQHLSVGLWRGITRNAYMAARAGGHGPADA